MSVNSSSSADLSPDKCLSFRTTTYVLSALSVAYILLLLPLSVLVLYLGYQQWRKQRYMSRAAATHSDLFTYHSMAMQLNEVLGVAFFTCGTCIDLPELTLAGLCVCSITSSGQALFHLLTSVERYLAVVHPITYLGLKQAGGARNITTGCVWLLSAGWLAVNNLSSFELIFSLYLCSMAFSLIVVSFCSISILCALRRPGPGEVGGNRQRADQSKQRASHTIMAILGVLLLRFGGNLTVNVIYTSSDLDVCVALITTMWFELPSRLVLPLLYLHRAGKLPGCKHNTESG